MGVPSGYAPATRHPWPCLLFVLPMLIAYEIGVLSLGGLHPETIRNGADHWLRSALVVVGVRYVWVPPLVLSVVFAFWAWKRREDRPGDIIGVLSGMVLESIIFALGLWALSRVMAPLMLQAGIELMTTAPIDDAAPTLSTADSALRQVVTYLGAGIYEEALFRLALFSAIAAILRAVDLARGLAVLLAALGSAVLFSTAHHIGPFGQAYSNYLFLFRVAAGMYFALLYQLRGFGIAVGAHACYNLMVSIA
jgi:hypothetical protein